MYGVTFQKQTDVPQHAGFPSPRPRSSGVVCGMIVRDNVVTAVGFGETEKSMIVIDGTPVQHVTKEIAKDFKLANIRSSTMTPALALLVLSSGNIAMWPATEGWTGSSVLMECHGSEASDG